MRFIFAPDSFKGTLTAQRECELLTQAAREAFPTCETVSLPMADGGEGTVDAVLAAAHGTRLHCTVCDPLGGKVDAAYGMLPDGTAIIEMSAASGLPLVPVERRDAAATTTFGTGELMRDALDRGAKALCLCVGGSATNDGGIGAMAALGVRFYDAAGQEVAPCGASLSAIDRIDASALDPRVRSTPLTVLCDVQNPLVGADGATHVFAPQKGASPAQVEALEAGMRHYASLVGQVSGVAVADTPGCGAAGGLSAALLAFCGGKLASGIETVLSLVGFDDALTNADLVITGEGKFDAQSAMGKVISGVGRHANAKSVPVAVIAGICTASDSDCARCHVRDVYALTGGAVTPEMAMADAERHFLRCARTLFAQEQARGK